MNDNFVRHFTPEECLKVEKYLQSKGIKYFVYILKAPTNKRLTHSVHAEMVSMKQWNEWHEWWEKNSER